MNQTNTSKRIDFAIKSMGDIRLDLTVPLFLVPVALAFNNIVTFLVNGDSFKSVIIIALGLLFVSVLNIVSIILCFINIKELSILKKIVLVIIILILLLSITLAGAFAAQGQWEYYDKLDKIRICILCYVYPSYVASYFFDWNVKGDDQQYAFYLNFISLMYILYLVFM